MTSLLDRVTQHVDTTRELRPDAPPNTPAVCHVCDARTDARRSVLATMAWLEAPSGELFCGRGCVEQYQRLAPRHGLPALTARPVTPDVQTSTLYPRPLHEKATTDVTVHLRCARCAATYEMIGSTQEDGRVLPDPLETAAKLGAIQTRHGWACSATCAALLENANAKSRAQPVPADVRVLSDQTTARRLQRKGAP